MTVWLMLQELSFTDSMAGLPVHAHSKFSKLTASITGFDIFLNSPNCCKSHDLFQTGTNEKFHCMVNDFETWIPANQKK